MHTVLAGLMVFLLGILEQFAIRLTAAMGTLGEGSSASATMGLQNMFSFNAPQINFLTTITVGMILILAVVNAFAIVACEGTHLIKITYYLSFLLILSGLCFIIIGPLAATIV
jgi:archaellum biogenesis protein FlaJ (TadC family)